jgi:hypothetical protein
MSGKISNGCSLNDLAMGSEPENRRYSLSRAGDKKLWESAKTDTLSYTVSHLSFGMATK